MKNARTCNLFKIILIMLVYIGTVCMNNAKTFSFSSFSVAFVNFCKKMALKQNVRIFSSLFIGNSTSSMGKHPHPV